LLAKLESAVLPLSTFNARGLFVALLLLASYGFLKDTSGIPSHWMPNDKLMHVLVFWVLGLSFMQAFVSQWRACVLWLCIYGTLVEVAQATFTNRMGDPLDWLADVGGILLALACYRAMPALWFGRL